MIPVQHKNSSLYHVNVSHFHAGVNWLKLKQ